MADDPLAAVSLSEGSSAMVEKAKTLLTLTREYNMACIEHDRLAGYTFGKISSVSINIGGTPARTSRAMVGNFHAEQPYFEDMMKPLQKQLHDKVQALYKQIQQLKDEI